MRVSGILIVFLAVLMASSAALAEDAPASGERCPPVYGTWRTTHVIDKFGNPQELDPPKGRRRELMEATIDEHKAVLTWNGKRQPVTEGRKKRTFKRVYRYEQTPYSFGGIAGDGLHVELITNFDMVIPYPDNKCYLFVSIYTNSDDVGSLINNVLMIKVK